jgi:uncharacterized protein (TIGR02594 family)
MSSAMVEAIVKSVQTRLQELRYYGGGIDGDAGPKTEDAMTEFKRAHGLTARPYPVISTLHLLFDEDAKPAAAKAPIAAPDGSKEPAWMVDVRSKLGLHEVNNYTELSKYLRSDGATLGDPRKLPWCGDLVATAIKLALPDEPLPANPYLARNWLKFGVETKPRVGAVMVFWRGSRNGISGHVAFYVGEDATTYHILGGNQSNKISITRIAKDRFLGARWPKGDASQTGSVTTSAGGAISTNEA